MNRKGFLKYFTVFALTFALAVTGALATVGYSTNLRNAILEAIETDLLVGGTAPLMRIYSGTIPADCAAAITGTLLAEITLPSDPFQAASGGTKAKSVAAWTDSSANATGGASHYRFWRTDGTTCVMQGTITATGGGGDMTFDNTSVASGQPVTINSFTLTAPFP